MNENYTKNYNKDYIDKNKKYIEINIKLTESHYGVLMQALDLIARLGTGQMYPLEDLFMEFGVSREDSITIANFARQTAFPDFPNNSCNYGIYNNKTHESSKLAYDLIQTLRYEMYHKRIKDNKDNKDNNYIGGVNASPPMKCSKSGLPYVVVK